jgi:hypothetical protein
MATKNITLPVAILFLNGKMMANGMRLHTMSTLRELSVRCDNVDDGISIRGLVVLKQFVLDERKQFAMMFREWDRGDAARFVVIIMGVSGILHLHCQNI